MAQIVPGNFIHFLRKQMTEQNSEYECYLFAPEDFILRPDAFFLFIYLDLFVSMLKTMSYLKVQTIFSG